MDRRSGFSLLEMLLVASFIFMLMGITMPIIDDSGIEARDATRANDLRAVREALAHYKKVHGVYPSTAGAWVGDPTDFGGGGYDENGYIQDLAPDFIPALPRDPDKQFPTNWAGYLYRSDGADYKFMAFGTPENFNNGHPLVDMARPDVAWAVSSPGAAFW